MFFFYSFFSLFSNKEVNQMLSITFLDGRWLIDPEEDNFMTK